MNIIPYFDQKSISKTFSCHIIDWAYFKFIEGYLMWSLVLLSATYSYPIYPSNPTYIKFDSQSIQEMRPEHINQPRLILPEPHLTSPHLTSPHLTSPHLTSPHHQDKDNKVSTHEIFVCEQIKVLKLKTKEYY